MVILQVGTADALAFFLPGVVSQFAKVLHVSKTMISGAAGSVEAIDQAIRGLAEYLMMVLEDDANLSGLNISKNVIVGVDSKNLESMHSIMEELRQLPIKAQGQSKTFQDDMSGQLVKTVTPKSEFREQRSVDSVKGMGSLHVDRTKDWIEKTSGHVNKLLCATFPHVCFNSYI